MALVDRIPPEEREVPHEPGNFFTFRVLTPRQLMEARGVQAKQSAEDAGLYAAAIKGMDPAIVREATQLAQEAQELQAGGAGAGAGATDPSAGYDAFTLVKYGLVSWRGSGGPPGAAGGTDARAVPAYDGVKCDDTSREQLDETTMKWAARTVAEISQLSDAASPEAPKGESTSSAAGIAASGRPAAAELDVERPAVAASAGASDHSDV